VTGEMWKFNKAPYRLVLNGKGGKEIEWHCKHYMGRGLMKHYSNGAGLAKDMGIEVDKLASTFEAYNANAREGKDQFGKKYINGPFVMDDEFWVAVVCPVVHYCMGGVAIGTEAQVLTSKGVTIGGLFAAGEVTGGVHGNNRLGGSSLIDCVVYGRVAGASASKYLLDQSLGLIASGGSEATAHKRLGGVARQLFGSETAIGATISQPGVHSEISVDPHSRRVAIEIHWDAKDGAPKPQVAVKGPVTVSGGAASAASTASAAPAASAVPTTEFSLDDVAKHNTEKDCWVVVNGQVLNVTNFLSKHPGGKPAIMLFAGKDATAEFNMLHKADVVEKYAKDTIIGVIKNWVAPKGEH